MLLYLYWGFFVFFFTLNPNYIEKNYIYQNYQSTLSDYRNVRRFIGCRIITFYYNMKIQKHWLHARAHLSQEINILFVLDTKFSNNMSLS